MTLAAFLSFGAADAEAARAIARKLDAMGLSVQLGIPGDRAQTLLDARCIVAIVSPQSEADDQARRDLVFALNNGKPVVPVLLAETPPEGWQRLLLDLQSKIDARAGLSEATLERIGDAVRAFVRAGRTIAMLNIKGGVGKTVLAANLFAAAHLEMGKSVCFIDLDPQHNLSQFFLPPEERNRVRAEAQSVYSVFIARGPLAAPRHIFSRLAVPLNRTKPGDAAARFDLIVGDERLFEFTLDVRTDRERADAASRFHDLATGLRAAYDLVVIDVNPCATFLTRCAITAADHIVAPVRPERYSLTGLNMLESVVREIRGRPLKPAEFSVLLNAVGDRPRTRFGIDVDQSTREEISAAPFFGSALLDEQIPFTVNMRTTPVDRYAPNPINLTAMRLITQRSLKESLATAVGQILKRAGA